MLVSRYQAGVTKTFFKEIKDACFYSSRSAGGDNFGGKMEKMVYGLILVALAQSVVFGILWAIFFRGANPKKRPTNQMTSAERYKVMERVG